MNSRKRLIYQTLKNDNYRTYTKKFTITIRNISEWAYNKEPFFNIKLL